MKYVGLIERASPICRQRNCHNITICMFKNERSCCISLDQTVILTTSGRMADFHTETVFWDVWDLIENSVVCVCPSWSRTKLQLYNECHSMHSIFMLSSNSGVPQLQVDLWKTSGHFDFYKENMYAQMKVGVLYSCLMHVTYFPTCVAHSWQPTRVVCEGGCDAGSTIFWPCTTFITQPLKYV